MTSRPVGDATPDFSTILFLAPFAGYPYLVTRIGHSPIRHMAILPADWPRERLLHLARRQAEANQMDTVVRLGPTEAIYIYAGSSGSAAMSSIMPLGIPVVERLALAESIPTTPEIVARRAALEAFAKARNPGGYLTGDGLEGGRPASAVDFERLGGRGLDGLPAGLARCPTCDDVAGDYLALRGEGNGDKTPRVIRIHCCCDNHNRCAGCGGPLAERRLSAYRYDASRDGVEYWAAYIALAHRCPK